jgi:hypothetical protein
LLMGEGGKRSAEERQREEQGSHQGIISRPEGSPGYNSCRFSGW